MTSSTCMLSRDTVVTGGAAAVMLKRTCDVFTIAPVDKISTRKVLFTGSIPTIRPSRLVSRAIFVRSSDSTCT